MILNKYWEVLKGMRSVWEDLFTQYGRRLTPDALDDFEKNDSWFFNRSYG